MPTLPTDYLNIVAQFAPLFSKCLWAHIQVLVVGAILTPGQRTVTAVLRLMGLSTEPHFQTCHRVLNRAVWSSWEVSRVLLQLLVQTFAPRGPLIVGIDDTIERRWGAKIRARGIYRDPVRSSHSHFVKTRGLRWLSLMLVVPLPWAKRVWALPFLTVLAPSERYYRGKRRAPKKLTDWAQQALLQVRRWLPTRDVVIVADSSFAVISLLARLRRLPKPVGMITRFRLDAGEGPTLAHAGVDRATAENALDAYNDPRLVWRRCPCDRDRLEHRRVVSLWSTAGADSLGLDS